MDSSVFPAEFQVSYFRALPNFVPRIEVKENHPQIYAD